MTRYLTQVLRLKVNPKKSQVRRIERLEYLGFTFQGIRIIWSERAFQDFKHRLRELTSRRWRVSMDYRLKRISLYLRGWMGYFGISQRYGPIPELDGWLRRRIMLRNADANGCAIGNSCVDQGRALATCSSWEHRGNMPSRRA
ncbi:MAG: group II intron maturase-specific domain-containing protein [Elainellaceae cyanobacterium]